jgi:hypothetical protein
MIPAKSRTTPTLLAYRRVTTLPHRLTPKGRARNGWKRRQRPWGEFPPQTPPCAYRQSKHGTNTSSSPRLPTVRLHCGSSPHPSSIHYAGKEILDKRDTISQSDRACIRGRSLALKCQHDVLGNLTKTSRQASHWERSPRPNTKPHLGLANPTCPAHHSLGAPPKRLSHFSARSSADIPIATS